MFTLAESLALLNLPGALASETMLVQAWLKEHGSNYRGFDYNVRVGDGSEPPANMPEPWRSQAIQNSRKIIDVVAYRDDGIGLFEAKGRIDPGSVGQVSTYTLLWERQHPDLPVREVGIIGAILDSDMLFVLNRGNIPYYVYPELAGRVKSA